MQEKRPGRPADQPALFIAAALMIVWASTSKAQDPKAAEAVRRGDADVAVAAFAQRVGGGFGLAVGFARWA